MITAIMITRTIMIMATAMVTAIAMDTSAIIITIMGIVRTCRSRADG